MLKQLEKYFTLSPKGEEEVRPDAVKIATAALFLEMAYADYKLEPEEEAEIIAALKSIFDIDEQEIDDLLLVARQERQARNDIYGFTNLLTKHFSRRERLLILDKLWMLIFTDGRVDRYEDALIRKMTGLLGLEHGDMINAKLRIRNQMQNKP